MLTPTGPSRKTPRMTALLLLINALVAIAMVILILLQRTDASAGGVFGGSGSNQPVLRSPRALPTAVLAVISLCILVLLPFSSHLSTGESAIMAEAPAAEAAGQALPAPGEVMAPEVSATVPASATVAMPVSTSSTETPSPTVQ